MRKSPYLDQPEWSAFNPSIMLSNEDEYWMAFRSSNYVLLTTGSPALTAEKKIRNEMYLVRLNPDTWEFDESTLKKVDIRGLKPTVVRNIEDPRMFWDGQNYCISATFLEIDCPSARMCKVTLESLESAKPINIEIYRSASGKIEKNWMPIHKVSHQSDATVEFIHKSDQLFLNNTFLPIPAPAVSRPFRGGSQVIPIDEESSISIIHELYYKKAPIMNPSTFAPYQSFRHYTHRFVKYNKNYEITHVSPKFVFIKEGIEFASGITEKQSTYVISFGRSDRASFIATIDKKIVFSMLEEVNG